MRGDETALVLESLAAVNTVDDLTAHDERAADIRGALGVVSDFRFPYNIAVARVQCHHKRILGWQEHLVVVKAEVAHCREATLQLVGQLSLILPQQCSGPGVQRLDDVTGVGQVHHAVMHKRRGLVRAIRHCPNPGKPQIVHVVTRDLVQWAVAPAVVRPAEH